jgi:hypothetical protein
VEQASPGSKGSMSRRNEDLSLSKAQPFNPCRCRGGSSVSIVTFSGQPHLPGRVCVCCRGPHRSSPFLKQASNKPGLDCPSSGVFPWSSLHPQPLSSSSSYQSLKLYSLALLLPGCPVIVPVISMLLKRAVGGWAPIT